MNDEAQAWLARRYEVLDRLDGGIEIVRDRLAPMRRGIRKTASDDLDRRALARERDVLALVRHRAFRRCWTLVPGTAHDVAYFEMVEGPSLDEALASDPSRARDVAVHILRALGHLHACGYAHGDLKPEHVRVDPSGVRILDLGMTAPLGAVFVGGTHGYLAPELLRGDPVSVQSDLFALGVMFSRLACDDETVARLAARCVRADAAERPASCDAALASLGAQPHALAPLPTHPGAAVLLDDARAVLSQADGGCLALVGGDGSGRSHIVERLAENAMVASASLAASGAFFERLAALWIPRPTAPAAAIAIRAATRRGIGIVLDDADRASPQERRDLELAVETVRDMRRGGMVIVGCDESLAESLAQRGAHVRPIDSLEPAAIDEWLTLAAISIEKARRARLDAVALGRPGRWARIIGALAEDPRLDDQALADIACARERAPNDLDAHMLAARGHLDEALAHAPRSGSQRERLDRAHWLERAGRAREARDETLAMMDEVSAEMLAEVCVLASASAWSLGDLDGADLAAERGLSAVTDPAARAHLFALQSDVALARGSLDEAITIAERACKEAESATDPLPRARARARRGAALALAGRVEEALVDHTVALQEARDAGDVSGLPTYLLNLATAEHGLSRLGDALRHYQEAARAADLMGRQSTSGIALLNTAALFETVSATDDARETLERARERLRASGAALYLAQADLIGSEVEPDLTLASDLADRAAASFAELGAERQALEATIRVGEIAVSRGRVDLTRSVIERTRDADRQGLGARHRWLRASLEEAEGRHEPAFALLEEAADIAAKTGDRDLHARILRSTVAIHRQLRTGGELACAARLRESVAQIAATLPQGLRDGYVRARALTDPVAQHVGPSPWRRVVSFTGRVLRTREPRALLEALVDEALSITGAERAFLLERRERVGAAVTIARNVDKEAIRKPSGRYSRSIAERVLDEGEPLLLRDARIDPDASAARSVHALGLRSVICVPIRSEESVVGVLYLDHRFREGMFDVETLELTCSLADIIALAFDRATLIRSLETRTTRLEQLHREARAQEQRRRLEVERLTAVLADRNTTDGSGLIGASRALRTCVDLARRVAPSTLPVLIEGPSGTGKELIARFIHQESPRARHPFISVNCAAIPESLLEAELFGYVRGAFTGAERAHRGLVRAADSGTLLLDEVGEMPLAMQSRLLRTLQEGEVHPIGQTTPVKVNVRVIAATNRTLDDEVRAGRFREDLYYRLLGVRVTMPSLRERAEDIPLLANELLARIAKEPGMRSLPLSRDALAALLDHDWPGNVRELISVLRRGALIARGSQIEPEDLGFVPSPTNRAKAPSKVDRRVLEQALSAEGGNRSRAAKRLGIGRATLYRWMR